MGDEESVSPAPPEPSAKSKARRPKSGAADGDVRPEEAPAQEGEGVSVGETPDTEESDKEVLHKPGHQEPKHQEEKMRATSPVKQAGATGQGMTQGKGMTGIMRGIRRRRR